MITITQDDVSTQYCDSDELLDISSIMSFTDIMSGNTHRIVVTPEEAAAFLWVIVSGCDDPTNEMLQMARAITDPLLEDCPRECRPIP